MAIDSSSMQIFILSPTVHHSGKGHNENIASLYKLQETNQKNILMGHLNIVPLRNKFEMLSLTINNELDLLMAEAEIQTCLQKKVC